jgi:hypothetical protein
VKTVMEKFDKARGVDGVRKALEGAQRAARLAGAVRDYGRVARAERVGDAARDAPRAFCGSDTRVRVRAAQPRAPNSAAGRKRRSASAANAEQIGWRVADLGRAARARGEPLRTWRRDRRGRAELELVLTIVQQDIAHLGVLQPADARLSQEVDNVRSIGPVGANHRRFN